MTWTSTGLAVGVALGASAAGWVVDAAGAARGYLVPGAAGLLAALVAFAGYRRLRPQPTSPVAGPAVAGGLPGQDGPVPERQDEEPVA